MDFEAKLGRTRSRLESEVDSIMENRFKLTTAGMWEYSFHVDTDHIGEMVELWRSGRGLFESMSLETRKLTLRYRK